MDNSDVSKALYEIADYLELQGVAFKPQAYRKAARNIEMLPGEIADLLNEDRLGEIPGVGKAIADKITELMKTGHLEYLEELRAKIPKGVIDLLSIPEIGPKTAMVLYRQLGIEDVDSLKKAIFEHRLSGLKGFGVKTEERILRGIRVFESRGGRIMLGNAFHSANKLIDYLRSKHADATVSVAGSLRRMRETIGDIDILVATSKPGEIMESFVSYDSVEDILAQGDTKSSVRLINGIQVDLRAVPESSYGAALQYFTGSKEHNVELRKLAISKEMKISEYGLFDRVSDELVAGADEAEVYDCLGLQYIPPELRENRGEIEVAMKRELPMLIEYDDLLGDLHCHTEWSDASGTIEEILRKASEHGYEYVGITDHSKSLRIARGLSEERLRKQIDVIHSLREETGGPFLLAGSEVDVLEDGKLDYPNEILEQLDYAIMSIHSKFNLDERSMTERIVTAMSNDAVKIFAHPTGRIIGQRLPYTFDLEKVIESAIDQDVALEINSFPERLDLNDTNVRRAVDAGAKIAIGSDAHDPSQLAYTRFGIATARRGWAKKSDVMNTLPLDTLKKMWGI